MLLLGHISSAPWLSSIDCREGLERGKKETMNYPALGDRRGSGGIFLIFNLAFLFSRQQ